MGGGGGDVSLTLGTALKPVYNSGKIKTDRQGQKY